MLNDMKNKSMDLDEIETMTELTLDQVNQYFSALNKIFKRYKYYNWYSYKRQYS